MSDLLFAYGSLREGEPDHDALREASALGFATATGVRLVDLGPYPALVAVGAATASDAGLVVGELYGINAALLARLDVVKQHPALFQRRLVTLVDGRSAYAYMMGAEQVRGRKRLSVSDWKKRFERPPRPEFTVPRRWHR